MGRANEGRWSRLVSWLTGGSGQRRTGRHFIPVVEQLEDRTVPSDASAGATGIMARGLIGPDGATVLTGLHIGIGQVETGRPGLPGFDNAGAPAVKTDINDAVRPGNVYLQDRPAVAAFNTTDHAEGVAGVMIAHTPVAPGAPPAADEGVAPGAALFASGIVVPEANRGYQEAVLAMQEVASHGPTGMRAINLSFGNALPPGGKLDGSSFLTAAVDWSARVQNVLYVVASNENTGGIPLPTDQFNGLTVALTNTDVNGTYRRIDGTNNYSEDAAGLRRSTSLVAPGQGISSTDRGNATAVFSGSSFAAPHVTGTVALLQEYAETNITNAAAGWNADARQHEVMKAVLMNSTDKIVDVGDGSTLGMTRTITKKNDVTQSWATSDARDDISNPGGQKLPLDLQMGTGQLNASRALTQFQGGETHANGGLTVPPIGWDYGTMGAAPQRYSLGRLKGGTYVSLTLAWDRVVNLIDRDGDGKFSKGDGFSVVGLPDLDIYLMPAGATTLGQALWSSSSSADSVEHIFFKLPATSASYEIWVVPHTPTTTKYALAWWTVADPLPVPDLRIAGRVWQDSNLDGLQNPGEAGVSMVHVDLYDVSGNWIDTTTTDSNGNYAVNAVAPGSYYVQIRSPINSGFTLFKAGTDDSVDSDVDFTGRSQNFVVSSSGVNSVDAGLVPVPFGSIGGIAWNDANGNGIQDVNERGIADTVVYLYDPLGDLIDVTSTDQYGQYQFASVKPGDYYVQFENPYGYSLTQQGQGSDDTRDSDAAPDGRTAQFHLSSALFVQHVDAGYCLTAHYEGQIVAVGPDAGAPPLVEVLDGTTNEELNSFYAYDPSFLGGVRVATGDVNGDGFPDIITGPGAGMGSYVEVFSGFDNSLLYGFDAFPGYSGGVNVACGDINADGKADIIVSKDAGSTPDVHVYSGADGSLLSSFLAFDPSFTGGVHVAAGDVDGDGKADIIVGAGSGSVPQVNVFSGANNSLLVSFLAFDSSFSGGVNVAAGDINGDGKADIIVGAGAGTTPQVKIFRGYDGALLNSFLAFDSTYTGGVRVEARDINGDGIADIFTGMASSSSEVALFDGLSLAQINSFFAYDPQVHSGLFLG